ncbi:MAG TPA: glycosyltransferase N-terminal domain-containing protein, partial [Gammaproteobacteria bacterium]|nr:glycosyltransferase N-terminal domain-containing protein [Gammaproteobacteria bacterium]
MHTAAVKHTLYDIALHFVVAAVSPYYAFRMITGSKYREGLPERFGRVDRRKTASLVGGPVVWVHAVSVGETKAVLPLVRMLKERHPGLKVAFTTVTRTGHDVAAREGEGLIDSLFYFPLDISWAVKNVIDMVDPDVAVVVEKEIWPNFFYTLRQRSIPLVVVNGTISDRSYRRFRRFRSVFGSVFRMVSFFCARTE